MDIAYLIRHPEELNSETLHQLRELVACFPYYQAARLLYLQNLFLLHDPTFDQELRRASLYLPNRRLLFNLVHGRQYELQISLKKEELLPAEKPTEAPQGDRTNSLISSFLRDTNTAVAKSGKTNKRVVTASPSSDYMSYLFQTQGIEDQTDQGFDILGLPTGSATKNQEKTPDTQATTAPKSPPEPDRTTDLISSFIGKGDERLQLDLKPQDSPKEEEEPVEAENENVAPEDTCFTETLAKIYIKQGKYERAMEIFTKLHLNNRKKSAYFADQIRFLQKLAINNKHKS